MLSRMRLEARLAALAVVTSAVGCAEFYVPQSHGRLAIAGGGIYKDGRRYGLGWFGGDADQAVAGDPRAEEQITTAQSQRAACTVSVLLELGLLIAAVATIPSSQWQQPAPLSDTVRMPFFWLTMGGIAGGATAGVLCGSAQTHMVNAVNMYNDDHENARSRRRELPSRGQSPDSSPSIDGAHPAAEVRAYGPDAGPPDASGAAVGDAATNAASPD
jgi:hypothetical protein